MLEYVFFDARPLEAFEHFLRGRGVQNLPSRLDDSSGIAAKVVAIPEDLGDALEAEIEAVYERLMDWDSELAEASLESEDGEHHAAGIVLNLQDGRSVYARVDPKLLGRILTVVSASEFGDIVNSIVDAVESPDERQLCEPESAASALPGPSRRTGR